MFYKAKVAVCSEVRTKHINAMWAPRRIFWCWTWAYVRLPLGFKRLKCILVKPVITVPVYGLCSLLYLSIIFQYLDTLSRNILSCVASWNVSTLKRLYWICNEHSYKAKCMFSDVFHLSDAGINLMGCFTIAISLTTTWAFNGVCNFRNSNLNHSVTYERG
jgi:hypothetical protein